MIIIPEIETVVILIPRTGTSSLRHAVEAQYPQSFRPYRHMEADGVPLGYDRWERVTVVRDPLDRLWSLYKFLKTFSYDTHDAAFVDRMRESVDRPFSDWLINNDVPFSTPYDSAGRGRYWPYYTARHPMPENRKSQFIYARPDLGTTVFLYRDIGSFYSRLGLRMDGQRRNATSSDRPIVDKLAADHIARWFSWDVLVTGAAAP